MGDLPKIVSELWQVMGETGESIRQSILYLIDTVSFTYSVVIKSEVGAFKSWRQVYRSTNHNIFAFSFVDTSVPIMSLAEYPVHGVTDQPVTPLMFKE